MVRRQGEAFSGMRHGGPRVLHQNGRREVIQERDYALYDISVTFLIYVMI
jgi:hypothetical protein